MAQLRIFYGCFVHFAAEELDLGARNCLFSTNLINYPNDLTTGHLCYGEVFDDCAFVGRQLFLLDLYDWAPEVDKGRTRVSNLVLLGL